MKYINLIKKNFYLEIKEHKNNYIKNYNDNIWKIILLFFFSKIKLIKLSNKKR